MHNDLPFLPCNGVPLSSKVQKVLATLEKKERYIVHYRSLKQALDNGLIVEKVYRAMEYKQSAWLSKYIRLNTEMRKTASNDFEKDFYKLMNNAVYGKVMECVRKRVKIELHCVKYNDHLSAVVLNNKIIEFNKPIFVGFVVLEVSKWLMYDYHYNVMKRHYEDDIDLMYMDTDSLIYRVWINDIYKNLSENSNLLDRMDTSNLPRLTK